MAMEAVRKFAKWTAVEEEKRDAHTGKGVGCSGNRRLGGRHTHLTKMNWNAPVLMLKVKMISKASMMSVAVPGRVLGVGDGHEGRPVQHRHTLARGHVQHVLSLDTSNI